MADDVKVIEHPDGTGTLIRVPIDLDTGDAKVVSSGGEEPKAVTTEVVKETPKAAQPKKGKSAAAEGA